MRYKFTGYMPRYLTTKMQLKVNSFLMLRRYFMTIVTNVTINNKKISSIFKITDQPLKVLQNGANEDNKNYINFLTL